MNVCADTDIARQTRSEGSAYCELRVAGLKQVLENDLIIALSSM